MNKLVLIVSFLISFSSLYPKEGMWVPIFLQGVIMDDMQMNGFKLSAEDVYSVNQSCLKDGVVHFGGGCTAEVISPNGLILTNHHCGYGTIQSHSNLEHDYLTDGFWAMSREEELPNPGLTATFIKRIEDVTDAMLSGIKVGMNEAQIDSVMKVNQAELIKKATAESHFDAFVRSFSFGNQYILFVTEIFKDVRLVGAPPSSIGKYGFDTDNWVWPRHTGDFSMFRIYADKDNNPAEYNEENIPYKAGFHFPISLDGYSEGDFTMVYGFPGRTEEYLTSQAVDFIMNVSNPKKIEIRSRKLEILDQKMSESDEVRIKYAAKQSSTSNAWKKWKGQDKGLERNDAIGKKKAFEQSYEDNIKQDQDAFGVYAGLLDNLNSTYQQINEVSLARDYYIEIAYYGVDAFNLGYNLISYEEKLEKSENKEDINNRIQRMLAGHFKNYDFNTDLAIFKAIMPIYLEAEDNVYKPLCIKEVLNKNGKNLEKWMDDIYRESLLTKPEELMSLFDKDAEMALKKLSKDKLYHFIGELKTFYATEISPAYAALSKELEGLNKTYVSSIQAVFPDRTYYADANGTLRVAYGRVEGMSPGDAVQYGYYTSLAGVIEKYDPDSYEYNLPQKLIDLFKAKDYGKYGVDGEMRVCFTASNHTSGGNSGSPVLNGDGQLMGLNFDRNWEGTMSDINYDINQCRNISVDIRYVLFIIDKFAGAGHLVDEMTLVHTEK